MLSGYLKSKAYGNKPNAKGELKMEISCDISEIDSPFQTSLKIPTEEPDAAAVACVVHVIYNFHTN